MNKKSVILVFASIASISLLYFFFFPLSQVVQVENTSSTGETKTALFANGCFWCVEADFEKKQGVVQAISGYADGEGENPTYNDYAKRGFREVVEVTYDPSVVSYEDLVLHTIRFGDPTDGEGSFYDRGYEYSPGIYFETEEEKAIAEQVIARINKEKIFDKPLALSISPYSKFFPAEEYHQDYYKKNPIRYAYYRKGSGRDAFIEKHWGKVIFSSKQNIATTSPWITFVKPEEEILRATLTPLQYEVTQEEGTEAPTKGEHAKNNAEGIYVDILSGEPLFSSKDKYDSGTGWPSFVRPLAPENIVLREDRKLFSVRTEVRSRYADSHLGHVFPDGPADRGGLRYCMNAAALRFVPKDKLSEEGYGAYLSQFTSND